MFVVHKILILMNIKMEIEESIDEKFQNLIHQIYKYIEKEILNSPYYLFGRSPKNMENKLYLGLVYYLNKLYSIDEREIESVIWINNNYSKINFCTSNNSRYIIPVNECSFNYVNFNTTLQNIELFPKLQKIGKRFSTVEGISGYLLSLRVHHKDFKVEKVSLKSYSTVYLPNYLLYQKIPSNSIELQIVIRSPFQNMIEFDPEIDDF